MADLVRTAGIVAGTHLRRMLRSRRMLAMLAIGAIPALPALFVSRIRGRGEPADLITHATWIILLQIAVPLIALIGGSAAAAEEISDRTITYVFTRPVSRAGFFLGRFAATLGPVAVVLAAAVLLVFGAVRHEDAAATGAGSALFQVVLGGTLVGGAVYTALFAALGARFRHPMIAGLGYVFAFEGLFANLPGKTQELSVLFHLRSLVYARGGPEWAWTATELPVVLEPGSDALVTLLAVFAVSLILGVRWIRRRQES